MNALTVPPFTVSLIALADASSNAHLDEEFRCRTSSPMMAISRDVGSYEGGLGIQIRGT
jgi:hypothetical protein